MESSSIHITIRASPLSPKLHLDRRQISRKYVARCRYTLSGDFQRFDPNQRVGLAHSSNFLIFSVFPLMRMLYSLQGGVALLMGCWIAMVYPPFIALYQGTKAFIDQIEVPIVGVFAAAYGSGLFLGGLAIGIIPVVVLLVGAAVMRKQVSAEMGSARGVLVSIVLGLLGPLALTIRMAAAPPEFSSIPSDAPPWLEAQHAVHESFWIRALVAAFLVTACPVWLIGRYSASARNAVEATPSGGVAGARSRLRSSRESGDNGSE
jgi:hypothetical protein